MKVFSSTADRAHEVISAVPWKIFLHDFARQWNAQYFFFEKLRRDAPEFRWNRCAQKEAVVILHSEMKFTSKSSSINFVLVWLFDISSYRLQKYRLFPPQYTAP